MEYLYCPLLKALHSLKYIITPHKIAFYITCFLMLPKSNFERKQCLPYGTTFQLLGNDSRIRHRNIVHSDENLSLTISNLGLGLQIR